MKLMPGSQGQWSRCSYPSHARILLSRRLVRMNRLKHSRLSKGHSCQFQRDLSSVLLNVAHASATSNELAGLHSPLSLPTNPVRAQSRSSQVEETGSRIQAPPNCCKKLTPRRMVARAASAALAPRLRTASRALRGHSQVGATRVPLVLSLWGAAPQLMRQSLD